MSISKPFMTITSLAVASIFGGGVYMMMNMGTIAQQITQRMATEALGVPVTMQNLEVDLKAKKATVTNLKIANPDGFEKPYAVTVDKIDITLEAISKEMLTFKDIAVTGTGVNLEVTQTGTNLQTIQQNMKARKQGVEESIQDEYVQPIKVIIDHLAVEDAQLNPAITLISQSALTPVTVPDIKMDGIGKKENGILAREAMIQVWNELSQEFSQAAQRNGFYEGLSDEVLEDIGASQIEVIRNKVTDGINNTVEGMRGFFGE